MQDSQADEHQRTTDFSPMLIKPQDLKEWYLDPHVIGQEKAKIVVSTALCSHYHRLHKGNMVGKAKSNTLLMGPTASGKTLILELACEALAVPYVIADATELTAEGYVGGKVSDLPRRLFLEANCRLEAAECGIIYIDEIDKLAGPEWGRDIGGRDVQSALLKLLQGTTLDLDQGWHYQIKDDRSISTENMLFFVSGAFEGIDQIAKERNKTMGFGAKPDTWSNVPYTIEDFVKYGMSKQFMGRFSYIAQLDELDEKQLYKVLKLENSPALQSKIDDFASFGIAATFTEPALRELAAQAAARKTGGRALKAILDEIALPYLFKLPSTSVREVSFTRDTISNPEECLERLIRTAKRRSKHVPDSTEAEVSAPTGNPARNPEQYIPEIRKLELPEQYHLPGAHYCAKSGAEPTAIFDVITKIQQGIDTYLQRYTSKYSRHLTIADEVRTQLVSLSLERGFADPETVIANKIGQYLETNRIQAETVHVTMDALSDPKGFVRKLKGKGK